QPSNRGHTRNTSIASVQGFRLSSTHHSCRLSDRNSVVAGEGMWYLPQPLTGLIIGTCIRAQASESYHATACFRLR
ncbi:hypothetical protein BD309DRAFT_1059705, partial [Dichomitus squalens]